MSLRGRAPRRRLAGPALAALLSLALPGCLLPARVSRRPLEGPVAFARMEELTAPRVTPLVDTGGGRDGDTAPAPARPVPPIDPAVATISATDAPPDNPSGPARTEEAIPEVGTHPIDLPTALRLAASANPSIGEAQARITGALARLQLARLELVPSLNAGMNYHWHTGPLQRSSGEILDVTRQSFYIGGGARSVAAESVSVPAINVVASLADALYDPLAARQRVDEARFDASATANETLLRVSESYFELLAASTLLAARRQTEAEAAEVEQITVAYAEVGEGREADARRAGTERRLRRVAIRQAEEQVAVAAAGLARLLQLDPSVRLAPAEDPLLLYPLVDPDAPVDRLVAEATRRRPEVAARSAGIAAAEVRLRQEVARPLLPSVWMGFSGAAFGGGSNFVPPSLGDFRGRTDFDVRLYWTLTNLGVGNLAEQGRARSLVGQAVADRSRAINLVREQISAARGEAKAQRERLRIAGLELSSAHRGFRRDLQRILAAADEARPIEVLDSLRQLSGAREEFIAAVRESNLAQFRLFVAMGSPPPLDLPAVRPEAPEDPASLLNADETARRPPPAPPRSRDGAVGTAHGRDRSSLPGPLEAPTPSQPFPVVEEETALLGEDGSSEVMAMSAPDDPSTSGGGRPPADATVLRRTLAEAHPRAIRGASSYERFPSEPEAARGRSAGEGWRGDRGRAGFPASPAGNLRDPEHPGAGAGYREERHRAPGSTD